MTWKNWPDASREAGFRSASVAGPSAGGLLTQELVGFPRHLSQHVGGMVITQGPLCELVPIENAAMPDRTVVQWDKDDLDALGILKVDCPGAGHADGHPQVLRPDRPVGSTTFQRRKLTLARRFRPKTPAVYDMVEPGRHDRRLSD